MQLFLQQQLLQLLAVCAAALRHDGQDLHALAEVTLDSLRAVRLCSSCKTVLVRTQHCAQLTCKPGPGSKNLFASSVSFPRSKTQGPRRRPGQERRAPPPAAWSAAVRGPKLRLQVVWSTSRQGGTLLTAEPFSKNSVHAAACSQAGCAVLRVQGIAAEAREQSSIAHLYPATDGR